MRCRHFIDEPAFRDPLDAGAEFQVLETGPDWYRVALPDGRQCWPLRATWTWFVSGRLAWRIHRRA